MIPDLAPHFARLLALTLLSAAACSPAFGADKLNICFENKVVLPWRTVERTGLNFDMLNRVETKADVSFVYQLLPWKRCLAKLKANEVDGAFTVSYNQERRQYGAFPGGEIADSKKRMHIARYFLVRKKGSLLEWDGKNFYRLDGKIAFQLGYSIGELLNTLGVPVDETSDSAYNVGRKVIAGRVAGAAMMDSDAYALLQGPLGPYLEMTPTPLLEKPYFLMLSHAMLKSRPEVAERIWKGIEEVRNGKDYIRLVNAAGVANDR
jgi:polar amino acid transport system substrate-binding protein